MTDVATRTLLAGIEAVECYGIVAVGPDDTIATWNRGAASLTGISAADALGRPVSNVLSDGSDVLNRQTLERIADRGGEVELWLRRMEGSRFYARVAVVRTPPEANGECGHTLYFRDATSLWMTREELQRSKSMFESILATATDAVICVDDSQRIIFFNEGAERIFRYEPEEVLGQPLDLLIPDRFASAHRRKVSEFGESPVVARQMGERGEIAGKRRCGEIFPAEASISKLNVGDRTIYTAVLRDITDRHEAQEELARQAEELARSNAELEQFAYVASHDLQEPLRMVASYTQLLARRYRGQLDADADEFIEFAVDGVRRMQSLINDLLAYSRVGRGTELTSVSTAAIVGSTLTALAHAITETDAKVTFQDLPTVHGDETQLRQLFQNLIQNGLKFHKPGVPPKVHIDAVDSGDFWHFRVADEGIGIAPEFRERIFVIFQRLHSRAEYPGTGIGLAICRKIVERHGGRIWVESDDNGTIFHFTLPKETVKT